jgi:hypothetical protein
MTESVKDGALDRATDPEYAAINPLAVVGLIVGLLGAAAYGALLAWNFLSKENVWVYQVLPPVVIIPLAGLALSLAALVRIRRSEGVQSGRRIAVAGIAIGAAVTLIFGAIEAYGWREESRTLSALGARSYEIVDALAAGRYDDVYAMIPADFRRRQAAGPQQFRDAFRPLFETVGPVVKRHLRSLQLFPMAEGSPIAPAEMRVDFRDRSLDLTFWFQRAADGSWEVVGISGGESFESQMRHVSETPAPPIPAPFQRKHEHEH